jgi:hypothetical protein
MGYKQWKRQRIFKFFGKWVHRLHHGAETLGPWQTLTQRNLSDYRLMHLMQWVQQYCRSFHNETSISLCLAVVAVMSCEGTKASTGPTAGSVFSPHH